ncbi:MAG: hypothetical protein KGS09_00500 [Nitrospirae bacterium]|nr:hypothetical protein [Nitrospirota bacterium]MBU6479008.1 hypothetical protein [Nitrospirota bacterium]MDE3041990.1 hypothetical protein [Nitrospirota bacterium]MDE3050861.1 hypothetical protein [Nitrospirota bacterium]MDE3219434.1 hypothetical protein [Nitrospirota bacterium]
MRAVSFPFLLAFFFSATQSQAAAPDLPEGTTILVQSSRLGPGWHIGRVELVREGCAMVWIPGKEGVMRAFDSRPSSFPHSSGKTA